MKYLLRRQRFLFAIGARLNRVWICHGRSGRSLIGNDNGSGADLRLLLRFLMQICFLLQECRCHTIIRCKAGFLRRRANDREVDPAFSIEISLRAETGFHHPLHDVYENIGGVGSHCSAVDPPVVVRMVAYDVVVVIYFLLQGAGFFAAYHSYEPVYGCMLLGVPVLNQHLHLVGEVIGEEALGAHPLSYLFQGDGWVVLYLLLGDE